MKLYSQLSVLIALCTSIATVYPMGKLCFDISPVQTLNYPAFEQELKLRLNKHPNNFEELNKSCQHMVYQVIGRNIIPVQVLPSGKSFGEQLIDFNYIDLLSKFLDHVSIEEHTDEYRTWLGSGIQNGNSKAVNVILDHASDDFIDASYVVSVLDSGHSAVLPMIKCLLARNLNLKDDIGADLLIEFVTEKNQHSRFNQKRRSCISPLIISGANHQSPGLSVEPGIWPERPLTPMNAAQGDLKVFMSNIAAARDGLFNIVQKNEIKIGFVGIGDYSRRHIKDIYGNNLLFYALLGKNKAVADKLFGLWPKMLWEQNFEGKAIVDHEQPMHNFIEMYLQDDELKPLAIMFLYLSKKF